MDVSITIVPGAIEGSNRTFLRGIGDLSERYFPPCTRGLPARKKLCSADSAIAGATYPAGNASIIDKKSEAIHFVMVGEILVA